MDILNIIKKRIKNDVLSREEINFVIENFTNGNIPDYQMSSLAMTWVFNEMNAKEITELTLAMMNSGKVYDLSAIDGIKIDKHSTGGVGDKVTLIVGPIVAATGGNVVKMSGRGLGFTGGTIDKLESIPGYNIECSEKELIEQVKKIKLAVVGQSSTMVPADKKLYALRDVTGTVESTTSIVSSIMSKKLATGTDAILLDVKCGNGAFMKNYKDAEHLAKNMIAIGKELNKDIRAEITSMSRPLGKAIGNKNEVIEAIEVLNGEGPDDLKEVVFSSASTMLLQTKIVNSQEEAEKKVHEMIHSGKAFDKFKEWITYQGGDVNKVLQKDFWSPKNKLDVKATKNGYFEITSAVLFGLAALKLGAGRMEMSDKIDNEAGIYLHKKTNETVKSGDVLFTLYSSTNIDEKVVESLKNAYNINENKVENKIILGKMG